MAFMKGILRHKTAQFVWTEGLRELCKYISN
jgi:hypothetical protein